MIDVKQHLTTRGRHIVSIKKKKLMIESGVLLIRLSAVMTVCHHWGAPVTVIKSTFTPEHNSALLRDQFFSPYTRSALKTTNWWLNPEQKD